MSIFTKSELEVLNKRFEGIKSDPTGVYCNRIKPKVKELLEVWIPKVDELKKLIE